VANMSYCRFQNTLNDLRDCAEALDYGDAEDENLSTEEKRAKEALIKVCSRIAADYGEDDD
jgi:hypothetical protein